MSSYSVIKEICGEIKKVYEANAISATAIMIYIAIDAMAFLSMPKDKPKNDSSDFIKWTTKYLKTDAAQPYQYDGRDVWAARCAMLHSYSSYSDYAEQNSRKLYGYIDGADHKYVPKESTKLVLISVRRLMDDFFKAAEYFLRDAQKNKTLKNKIDKRLNKICRQFNIEHI